MVPFQYHDWLPPKIRELIRDLKKAGFTEVGGRGSHRKFRHPKGIRLTISGRLGGDARKYQVADVKLAIGLARDEKK